MISKFWNVALSNGSKNDQNVIQMVSKWLFFAKKKQTPNDCRFYPLILICDLLELHQFAQNAA